ncbi:MAG: 6,7-dimethyl-8-ribityllumazine synthase [Paludibacter sp.]|jgi:6,7-dimethyl-8-ribityllumazine synthase|nr:6,7-dimethyl-8-ribityllumazine synthase [Paludibacter sp.]
MLKKKQNLSIYDFDEMPPKTNLSKQQYAIAVSDWNSDVTQVLLEGAIKTLTDLGVKDTNIYVTHVPGAFELIYAAKEFVNDYLCEIDNRKIKKYSAVIVLGCVIKGDTPHFDYICQGVTVGIAQLNALTAGCPVIYGLLTTLNMEQATERADGKHGNKGVEAAITAVKMANTIW